jgi:hypothetical protein
VDLNELYGLALDRFIPERASLVRELRAGGKREQAATVAAARKPSVAAWAVNQLVRTRRAEMDELLAAGQAVREAQEGVLAGSADPGDLRAAAARERAAVDGLVGTARGLLSSGGHELSAATLERVSETLHAAAVDDEARAKVSAGRLVRELRHAGLGAGVGGAFAPAQGRAPAKAHAPGKNRLPDTTRAPDKTRAATEAAERREREEARKQARATERDAARELDRAQRAVRAARERQTSAAEALRQADAGVIEAEATVEAAQAAHRQAAKTLDTLS